MEIIFSVNCVFSWEECAAVHLLSAMGRGGCWGDGHGESQRKAVLFKAPLVSSPVNYTPEVPQNQ